MKYYLSILGFILFISSACMRDAQVPDQLTSIPAATPTPAPRPTEKIDHDLEQTIARIADAAKAKVGVGAVLLETGDAAYMNRKEHFAMQSVYKLPIAMAVGQLTDRGTVQLDSDVEITPADYVRRGFHSPIRNLNPRGTVMLPDGIVRYSLSESAGLANHVWVRLG